MKEEKSGRTPRSLKLRHNQMTVIECFSAVCVWGGGLSANKYYFIETGLNYMSCPDSIKALLEDYSWGDDVRWTLGI